MALTRAKLLEDLVKIQGCKPNDNSFKIHINDYLMKYYHLENSDHDKIFMVAKRLSWAIRERWNKKGNRTLAQTISKYPDYFSEKIKNPVISEPQKRSSSELPSVMGAPKKPFLESSTSSQYNQINKIEATSDSGIAITRAAAKKLRSEGRKDDCDVINAIASTSGLGTKIKAALSKPEPISMTGDEGLAYMIRMNMTTAQYQEQRNEGNDRNSGFIPCYKRVKESMNSALPSNIEYREDEVVVSIQDVLNHQISRLLDQEMVDRLVDLKTSEPEMEVILYYKYGADGNSGNSQYSHAGSCDQNSMFLSSLVILQLVAQCPDWTFVIYRNRLANSPFSICPLRYKFEKETRENSQTEGDRLNNQAANIQPIPVPNTNISVSCLGNPTLIDTKCRAAWCRENASNRCPICGASPTQMSKRNGPFVPKPGTLKYGFSQVHVKLGFLRWCLKHRKNCRFKYHEARGVEHKAIAETEKIRQQEELEAIGICVDFPGDGGGSSNIGKICFTLPLKNSS